MKNINLHLRNVLIIKYINIFPSYRNYRRPFQSCRLASIVTEKRYLRCTFIPPPVPQGGAGFFALEREEKDAVGATKREGSAAAQTTSGTVGR